ncbi:acyl-CoA dehydrogenase [Solihabitans fulvus]|uniref:Acyl-CoA dehydrogenase n=1 Tax=Solihabitans fulvus TaxID=1892852 RepID=A0A5B2WW22_9PSEU|nr:acyl-CoA dehydrogenase family protein [Solihabitans fulvus]KAA2254646.1 acyl-CoA dehydrogenase [Solihabitans fulvus]
MSPGLDWLAAAEELADKLRADASARDRAAQPPTQEVDWLRQSGLLALPAWAGVDEWVTANSITRIVASADASVGHLLGYHYLQLWRTGLFDRPELADRLRRDTVEHGWFWAGVSNPLDAALRLTPTGDGFLVDGRKTFATGASVADRLVVSGTRIDDGEKLTFVVDAATPGITYLNDWDNLGQRLTASGGVVFESVPVAAADVLGDQPESLDDPRTLRLSLAALGFQLALAQIYVGTAEGALAEAAEFTRRRGRAWFLSGVERAVEDPYILAGYGELVSTTEAAKLVADQAALGLHAAFAAGSDLTEQQRGQAAVTVSAAKVVATRVVNETTSKIFEFIGARATANEFGFDRFWRNARTLTLHDPVVYKAREVGEYFLTGVRPQITGYS